MEVDYSRIRIATEGEVEDATSSKCRKGVVPLCPGLMFGRWTTLGFRRKGERRRTVALRLQLGDLAAVVDVRGWMVDCELVSISEGLAEVIGRREPLTLWG
jgi:hypothetical protein